VIWLPGPNLPAVCARNDHGTLGSSAGGRGEHCTSTYASLPAITTFFQRFTRVHLALPRIGMPSATTSTATFFPPLTWRCRCLRTLPTPLKPKHLLFSPIVRHCPYPWRDMPCHAACWRIDTPSLPLTAFSTSLHCQLPRPSHRAPACTALYRLFQNRHPPPATTTPTARHFPPLPAHRTTLPHHHTEPTPPQHTRAWDMVGNGATAPGAERVVYMFVY